MWPSPSYGRELDLHLGEAHAFPRSTGPALSLVEQEGSWSGHFLSLDLPCQLLSSFPSGLSP